MHCTLWLVVARGEWREDLLICMRKETTQPPEHPSTNYTDLFVRDYFIYLGDKNTLFFLTPHILVIEKLKKKKWEGRAIWFCVC